MFSAYSAAFRRWLPPSLPLSPQDFSVPPRPRKCVCRTPPAPYSVCRRTSPAAPCAAPGTEGGGSPSPGEEPSAYASSCLHPGWGG